MWVYPDIICDKMGSGQCVDSAVVDSYLWELCNTVIHYPLIDLAAALMFTCAFICKFKQMHSIAINSINQRTKGLPVPEKIF